MIKIKLRIFLISSMALLALGLAVFGLIRVSQAADSTTTSSTNPQSSLIDKLAEKFNLNKSDVQSVFESERAQRQEEMRTREKERLQQAVKDGVITQEQADKLIQKREEMRQQMEKQRTEMEQWYKDNGIDQSKLGDYLGCGFGRMGHGPRGMF